RQLIERHAVGDGRLGPGRGVRAVVEADVEQVRGPRGGDGGERAEVHEHVAVAVEDEHPPARLGEGHAEPDRGGEAHRADHVEALVAVARRAAGAADVAVGMDADGAVGDGGGEDGEGVREGHSKMPGRTTSATGRRVARMRAAAQSTSATIASTSGARNGTPKSSSTCGSTSPITRCSGASSPW